MKKCFADSQQTERESLCGQAERECVCENDLSVEMI